MKQANVLCLAGTVITDEHAAAMVKRFLETTFEANERHACRGWQDHQARQQTLEYLHGDLD
jgi:ribose 5-phosphate isomerase RpiB